MQGKVDGVGADVRRRLPLGLGADARAVLEVMVEGALEAHPPAYFSARELGARALERGVGPSPFKRALRELEAQGAALRAGGSGVWLPMVGRSGELLALRPRPLVVGFAEIMGALEGVEPGEGLEDLSLEHPSGCDGRAGSGRVEGTFTGSGASVWSAWELEREGQVWAVQAGSPTRKVWSELARAWVAPEGGGWRWCACGEVRSWAEVQACVGVLRAWALQGNPPEVMPEGLDLEAWREPNLAPHASPPEPELELELEVEA